MAEIEKKPVKVVETILRDAHQSLIATRMSTEQMLPIIEKLDKVGYYAVECWGGATFDASLRFLKEDPWERLRKLRDGFKNTKLQMLFRGQNILGYRPYADDVVEYFVQKSAANGIDIIRIFDCMNDLRNLQTAVKAANKEKAHAQVAMAYTLGDAYTLDYWTDLAKRIEDMGADSNRAYGWLKDSFEDFALKAQVAVNSERYPDGIVIAVVKDHIMTRSLMSQVADSLLSVQGIQGAFVIANDADNESAISARSDGHINVQVIMENMNGGGHMTAAAVQRSKCSLDTLKEELLAAIHDYNKEDETDESDS